MVDRAARSARQGTHSGSARQGGGRQSRRHKSLGDGLIELREHHGPGYRLYAGRDGAALVILVTGGDKSSQAKDIAAARLHWQDYRSRHHEKDRKP